MSDVPVREYDDEPVHGLPAELPEGERIVWQGSPCPLRLAKTAFHLRAVAGYFALLVAAMAGSRLMAGEGAAAAFDAAFWTMVPAMLAIGLILFLGWAYARGTVYTLTNHRLVIRTGLALTAAVDIPYSVIDGAALKSYGDGTGDLVIQTRDGERASWVMLWPNTRPWCWRQPQAMLRVIPEANLVATLLTRELRREARMEDAAEMPLREEDRSRAHAPHLTPALG